MGMRVSHRFLPDGEIEITMCFRLDDGFKEGAGFSRVTKPVRFDYKCYQGVDLVEGSLGHLRLVGMFAPSEWIKMQNEKAEKKRRQEARQRLGKLLREVDSDKLEFLVGEIEKMQGMKTCLDEMPTVESILKGF